jgi:hypothetical protein
MFNTTTVSSAFGFNTDPEPEDPKALHVIIVHDDHAAYVRALRMLANTFFGRPEAAAMRPLPWRFDELHSAPWRRRATADVPRAEVFVVSASKCSELPENVSAWLHECFALRQNRPTAVVALGERLNDFEVPWRRLLREAVVAAGLDFIEAGTPAMLRYAN